MLETLAWIGFGATLIPAHRAAREQSRAALAALVAVEVVAVAMCVLAVVSEQHWSALAQEDGSVEWATFLAFVFAAGWLVFVVRKVSASWWFKGACLMLALFCLAVAGEEISWGQRLFGFKPPDVFLERNFQQELNIHNVLMDERGLGFKLESKHLVMAIVIGFCGAWPWLVRRRRFEVFAPLAPPLAFAPLGIGVVAAQMAYNVELTGEGAELVTGLIFFAAALVVTKLGPRAIVAWIAVPCFLGLVMSVLVSRVMFGSDEVGTQTAGVELALLAEDIVDGTTDKLRRKNVHKRLFTSTRDGYVTLVPSRYLEGRGTPAVPGSADPRHDRRGYFLDPWNNPYWLQYNRRSRRGMIYSFGPNRRRDVVVRDAKSDPGDDVIVRFTIDDVKQDADEPGMPGADRDDQLE